MSSAAGIGRTRDPENNQSLNTITYLSLEREVDRLFTQHSNTTNVSNLKEGLNRIYDKARSLQDPGLNTSTTEKIGDYIHSRLKSMGVDRALHRAGVKDGETVRIGRLEFDYESE